MEHAFDRKSGDVAIGFVYAPQTSTHFANGFDCPGGRFSRGLDVFEKLCVGRVDFVEFVGLVSAILDD